MAITLLDALKLDKLKSFRLMAGSAGLENTVEKVGILDWEFDMKVEDQFARDELTLTSFLWAKDDPELVFEAVKSLVRSGVSGLAIKNVYYKELPEKVTEYANEHNFPIFIFDNTAFFEDIITDITNAIRDRDNYQLFATKVDLITNHKISKSMIRELALEINGAFHENVVAAYLREKRYIDDGNLLRHLEGRKRDLAARKEMSVFMYKSGILVIQSFAETGAMTVHNFCSTLGSLLGIQMEAYHVGVGECHRNLSEMDKVIFEGLHAQRTAELMEKDLLKYRDIGIYKILLPSLEEGFLRDFSNEIIQPMAAYDEKYHTEILRTAISYVENDGSIKKTSEALFQHDNTIRYRINKMKELLGMEGLEGSFYEQLAIAVKIYKALGERL